MERDAEWGLSVLELLVGLAIAFILTCISLASFRSTLYKSEVETAYTVSIGKLQQARQAAVVERRVYVMTFTLPRNMQIERVEQDATLTPVSQDDLPYQVEFRAEPGIPTDPTKTPDQFGTGSAAIDLNGSNRIYFQVDGSAMDAGGHVCNGVIYLARAGDLTTVRALTVMGLTGRIKGWRLTRQGSDLVWN
jgi:Tfp pilus assembly protein FimT